MEKKLFDTSMPVAADFDLMMRFMEDPQTKCVKYQHKTVRMLNNGKSSTIKGILQGFKDIRRSLKKNDIKVNLLWYIINRYLPKIKRKLSKGP